MEQCQSLADRFGTLENRQAPYATNDIECQKAHCPYCGESIELLVDGSEPQQSYIEDCQVCCRPINCEIDIDQGGNINLTLRHEDE